MSFSDQNYCIVIQVKPRALWNACRAGEWATHLEMWEFLLVLVADLPDCMLCLSLGELWWLSDLGLEENKRTQVRIDISTTAGMQKHALWFVRWPGLFAAGLLRQSWADLLLSVGFVFDWLLLVALFLLRSVSLWPHSLWTFDLWASFSVGSLSFTLRALLVYALAPLSPLLLGWGRHRVLLSHLLGNQLGVDPGFPVEEIQGTNMD